MGDEDLGDMVTTEMDFSEETEPREKENKLPIAKASVVFTSRGNG